MNASVSEVVSVALKVANHLEELSISYFIGGSVASSLLGEPRSTNDVDFVAQISSEKVRNLVQSLQSDFYISAEAVMRAVEEKSSFNVIHLRSIVKIDIFVLKPGPYSEEEMRRRISKTVTPEGGESLYVCSAEDLILNKLCWFKSGGCTSERQWLDVRGVLAVQKQLDHSYMQCWAKKLGLSELMDRAVREASSA